MIELQNRHIEAKVVPDPGFPLYFGHMQGEEELGRPFRYEVEMLSPAAGKPSLLKLLGSKMTIKVKLQTTGKFRYFNGIITQARYLGLSGEYERYRFELRPEIWLLKHQVTSTIYQNKKLIEVVEQVLRTANITVSNKTMNASSLAMQEFCVQFCESTFDFISRLMEEAGVYYFHEHTDGVHKLVLADDPNCHAPLTDAATIEFYDSDADYRRNLDHVWDWLTTANFSSAAYEQRDFNFETSAVDLTTRSRLPPTHTYNSFEVFDYPGQYGTAPEGTKLAAIRMQELAAARELVQAEGNVRPMTTGGTFTLKGFTDTTQNREYLVIAANYSLTTGEDGRAADSNQEAAVADTFKVAFRAVPATVMFRPRRLTPRPIIHGPQTAIVVGPPGQEIHTDKFGRVKVRFFWDRSKSPDADASCWIRVSQAWAGVGWGGMNIPRVKQEVIVEFLDGNPDRPIITGRVYNDVATVPYALPANQTRSTLKSATSPGSAGFNEIRMEDKQGVEELYVHAQKDMNVDVLNDQTSKITNNRSVTIEKGNDTLTVSTGNRLVEVSTGNETTKIAKGNQTNTVSMGNQSNTVSMGNQTNTISLGNQTTSVSVGKSSLTAGQEISLTVGGSNIKMDPMSITLSMGASSIKIDAMGVTISGPTIKLSANLMLEANGGASTVVKGGIVTIN